MTALQSLADRVTPLETGSHVVRALWLHRLPVFALADGTVLFAGIGEDVRANAHPDASLLTAVAAADAIYTGGDDGRIIKVSASGETQTIADSKGKWIDALATKDGALVWSSGKTVTASDPRGAMKTFEAPSTVRGLAFAPKGYRVAIAHYNGVSFWFPNAMAAPERFEWKGSHIDVTVSPDGRFIVTSMQEATLHGWRVTDKQHMRMAGYPSKTRSLDWSHDGKWLATSGADAAIVWPFEAKDGPMGKAPRECGVRPAKVSQVAFHPKALVLAVGYEDGCILLCRLTDAAELLVRPAVKGSGVTSMAWDSKGAQLAFGSEDGAAGVLTLPAA